METIPQKEERLKKRKPVFTETYKKGVFYRNDLFDRISMMLKQEDILVRVHKSGELNDGTQFMNITIEGFDESKLPDIIG